MKSRIPFFIHILFIHFIVVFTGCSEHQSSIEKNTAQKHTFGGKEIGTAKIDFFIQYDKKTGAPLNIDTIFTLHDKSNIRAVVNLENVNFGMYPIHLFHLDWIDPEDRSIFIKKHEILSPDDIPLTGSMSISPDKRKPGNYKLKVYYFRKLISESSFLLLPDSVFNTVVFNRLKPQIAFGRSISKKTGLIIEKDTIFDVNNTRRIHVLVDFDRPEFYENSKMLFTLQWISPDGNSFFEKKIEHLPVDAQNYITSSVSVSADKRPIGGYRLKVFLYDELIIDKGFQVTSEQ